MEILNGRKFNLKPLPYDIRDRRFHRHKLKSKQIKYGSLGAPSMTSLPEEYLADGTISDNDQLLSNFCTDYSAVAVAERLDGAAYSRAYHAKCESELLGYNMATKGCDLRTALEVAVAKGFLPLKDEPFDWKKVGDIYAADPKNWPAQLDEIAKKYEHVNFTWVTGPYDYFHSQRAHLYDIAPKGTILAGTPWFQEWSDAVYAGNKILPMPTKPPIGYHAHVTVGWKWLNGKRVLIHETWQGVHDPVYFTQDVFNYAMSFSGTGAAILEGLDTGDIDQRMRHIYAIIQSIINIIRRELAYVVS